MPSTPSGTAAAVSIVLGNQHGQRDDDDQDRQERRRSPAQLTTNGNGGTSAKGLGITVPAGRAPITVNLGAGKATNLNADMVDGMDVGVSIAGLGPPISDGLDGIDSTGFVCGNGSMQRGAIALPPAARLKASGTDAELLDV